MKGRRVLRPLCAQFPLEAIVYPSLVERVFLRTHPWRPIISPPVPADGSRGFLCTDAHHLSTQFLFYQYLSRKWRSAVSYQGVSLVPPHRVKTFEHRRRTHLRCPMRCVRSPPRKSDDSFILSTVHLCVFGITCRHMFDAIATRSCSKTNSFMKISIESDRPCCREVVSGADCGQRR